MGHPGHLDQRHSPDGVMGTSGTNFGPVGHAKLNQPTRLAQVTGGQLLIADTGNNRIVLANSLGTISSALNSTMRKSGLACRPTRWSPAAPILCPWYRPWAWPWCQRNDL